MAPTNSRKPKSVKRGRSKLAFNISQLAPATAGHMGMVEEVLGHGLNSIFYGFSRGLFLRPPPTTDFVVAGCLITIELAITPVKGIIIDYFLIGVRHGRNRFERHTDLMG